MRIRYHSACCHSSTKCTCRELIYIYLKFLHAICYSKKLLKGAWCQIVEIVSQAFFWGIIRPLQIEAWLQGTDWLHNIFLWFKIKIKWLIIPPCVSEMLAVCPLLCNTCEVICGKDKERSNVVTWYLLAYLIGSLIFLQQGFNLEWP